MAKPTCRTRKATATTGTAASDTAASDTATPPAGVGEADPGSDPGEAAQEADVNTATDTDSDAA